MGKRVFVIRPILVNLDNGEAVRLPAGINTIDDELAKHWFVQANCQSFEDAVPDEARDVVDALRVKLDEVEKANADLQQQLQVKHDALVEHGKQAAVDKKRIADLERQLNAKPDKPPGKAG